MMHFGVSSIRAVPLPMPKPTLIGYIITMGFIVAILVKVLFSFSENPLATIIVIIILLAVAAVVTYIFVRLFVGLDRKRESVSRPPIGIASRACIKLDIFYLDLNNKGKWKATNEKTLLSPQLPQSCVHF